MTSEILDRCTSDIHGSKGLFSGISFHLNEIVRVSRVSTGRTAHSVAVPVGRLNLPSNPVSLVSISSSTYTSLVPSIVEV